MTALVLRLTAALLSGGTFDPDEFVVLALGRAVSNGAVPYHDITYYHPPGMLYLMATLEPLARWWWPISRVAMLAVDSLTAALVWRVGRDLFDARTALIAGLVYAVSPLALISATRVGPDPIITALGMLGLVQLLRTRGRSGPILAGVCLGLAVWTKYPALLFLPVYVLAAPRRAWPMLLGFGLTVLGLFVPFLVETRGIYADTVVWQLSRPGPIDVVHRLSSVGAYWLCLNCVSFVGLIRRQNPPWLVIGFCSGAAFLFTAQAYYHYFVPVVPFAALLAAPIARPLIDRSGRLVVTGAIAACILWALDVGFGPPAARLFISASRLSSAQRTAEILNQTTPARSHILADEFEYSLLARGRIAKNYFWNMQGTVSAHRLEGQLPDVTAVVETTGIGRTYPNGFVQYLEDHHFPRIQTDAAIVWILPVRSADVANAYVSASRPKYRIIAYSAEDRHATAYTQCSGNHHYKTLPLSRSPEPPWTCKTSRLVPCADQVVRGLSKVVPIISTAAQGIPPRSLSPLCARRIASGASVALAEVTMNRATTFPRWHSTMRSRSTSP